MITIRIGDETKSLADASENWITQQINRRHQDGQNVCVEVMVNTSGLNLRLATAGCGSGMVRGRPLVGREIGVVELWEKFGLGDPSFSGGNLIAFLKQLRRHL